MQYPVCLEGWIERERTLRQTQIPRKGRNCAKETSVQQPRTTLISSIVHIFNAR
ncbi:Uncharacterized protein APZ42_020775 [Daphnia magna]|uniref:Uncharacterized protein n=1 Tax=Daphnia magna TaxID=35525 RepID=A0A164XE00_9CRUS|nr:Uncharacterized protein APZ42_020775 [Daphnia magna]